MINSLKRLRNTAHLALIGLLAVAVCQTSAEAAPAGASHCAAMRLKVISKAVTDQLACRTRTMSHGRADAKCLDRTAERMRDRWLRADGRTTCPLAGGAVFDKAFESVKEAVADLIDENDGWLSPDVPIKDRLVFFLPLCQSPEDYRPASTFSEDSSPIPGEGPFGPSTWKPSGCIPGLALGGASFEGSVPDIESQTFVYDQGWGADTLLGSSVFNPYFEIMEAHVNHYCRQAAFEQGFLGAGGKDAEWDIWISDPGRSPADSFTKEGGRFVLPSGRVVADDWEDLTDGTLDQPIDEFVDTTPVPQSALAWTATDVTGEATDQTCGGWKDIEATATMGLPTSTSTAWTEGGSSSCSLPTVLADEAAPLTGVYCMQQSGPAPGCTELVDGSCGGSCGSGGSCRRLARGGCGCGTILGQP